jgi:hypothetical protein
MLNSAVAEAVKIDSMSSYARGNLNLNELTRRLADAAADAKEWALDENVIAQAEGLMKKLEVTQELLTDTAELRNCIPVRTQETYIRYAHALERTICRAEAGGVDAAQLDEGRALLKQCQIENWVCTLTNRLKDVECATDPNEHDMNRLKQAIEKATLLGASAELVEEASVLHRRLDAELGMTRAMLSVPVVKLPMDNPPEGYYEEKDKGMVRETPEYPYPPADTGEYIWEHSESYSAMAKAIEMLKKSYVGADLLGANPAVIAAAKEKLTKAEKEMKLLDAKDAADKVAALDAVAKAVKKLKKSKGKKK